MVNKITMYGAEWCPDCRRTKTYLDKNGIPFEYVNVDLEAEASLLVEKINNGRRIIPTLVINNTSYSNPQNHQLAGLLGLNLKGRVVIYGTEWCPDSKRVRHFFRDNQINYVFIAIDEVAEAEAFVMEVNEGRRITPTITINDIPYSNPSNELLTDILALDIVAEDKIYDVVIIGGGAAGLTTAIYAQRDRYDSLILERSHIGGNAFITKKIENYPGFNEVSGPELMHRMEQQAVVLGAEIETGVEVVHIDKLDSHFSLHTTSKVVKGKSVVIATGSTYRTLDIPGEAELIGSGIHFCATCDGAFYRDKEVIVIGGGNSALEEGMFLAGFCNKVTIVHRASFFSASEVYVEKLGLFNNITVLLNYTPEAFISGDNGIFHHADLISNETLEHLSLAADGVFVFAGLVPNSKAFDGVINLSETGHILTKGLNRTSMDGLFAAGDVRKGAIAQVAAATGEGVIASYGIREYLTTQL
jgi:thioredoxin reductase (NADPH)